MMRTTLVALAGALLLTGCLYTSPVPLAPLEQAEFDPVLLGTWYDAESLSGDAADELVIRRAGEREYDIQFTLTVPFSNHRSTERARAYMVRINGIPFLNVNGLENDTSKWVFFRYELVGKDGIEFRSLKEDITTAKNAPDLLAFIQDNIYRAEIYTDVARVRKRH